MVRKGHPAEMENRAWGLHAVIIKKSVSPHDAEMMAQDIIKRKDFKKRETKLSYRFRAIPKTKFVPKMFRSKKINKDITLVFGELLPQYQNLSGRGFFDYFKKGYNYVKEKVGSVIDAVKEKADNVKDAVSNYLSPKLDDYPNFTKKMLEQYGNETITKLIMYRKPIGEYLNVVINAVSLGKWNQLVKKAGYDKFFHLSLIAEVKGEKLNIEKTDVVSISKDIPEGAGTESQDVPLDGKSFTLNELMAKTRDNMGDQAFFEYDGFKNNCQVFVSNLLKSVGLYGAKEKAFAYQPIKEIIDELPDYVKNFQRGITDVSATLKRITGQGKEEEREAIRQKKAEIRAYQLKNFLKKPIPDFVLSKIMDYETELNDEYLDEVPDTFDERLEEMRTLGLVPSGLSEKTYRDEKMQQMRRQKAYYDTINKGYETLQMRRRNPEEERKAEVERKAESDFEIALQASKNAPIIQQKMDKERDLDRCVASGKNIGKQEMDKFMVFLQSKDLKKKPSDAQLKRLYREFSGKKRLSGAGFWDDFKRGFNMVFEPASKYILKPLATITGNVPVAVGLTALGYGKDTPRQGGDWPIYKAPRHPPRLEAGNVWRGLADGIKMGLDSYKKLGEDEKQSVKDTATDVLKKMAGTVAVGLFEHKVDEDNRRKRGGDAFSATNQVYNDIQGFFNKLAGKGSAEPNLGEPSDIPPTEDDIENMQEDFGQNTHPIWEGSASRGYNFMRALNAKNSSNQAVHRRYEDSFAREGDIRADRKQRVNQINESKFSKFDINRLPKASENAIKNTKKQSVGAITKRFHDWLRVNAPLWNPQAVVNGKNYYGLHDLRALFQRFLQEQQPEPAPAPAPAQDRRRRLYELADEYYRQETLAERRAVEARMVDEGYEAGERKTALATARQRAKRARDRAI